MKKFIMALAIMSLAVTLTYSQRKTGKPPTRKTTAAKTSFTKAAIDPGEIKFRTYTNKTFNFSVTFPDTWLIPDNDFEDYMKSQGFDLTPKVPAGLTPITKSMIKQSVQKLTILLTAYKRLPGMDKNAVVRISAEDLKPYPQIKDAVDYIDAMRGTLKTVSLPGFKYSETQAEQLGKKQFAFIDTETNDDKRRLYATVRGSYALMFSISYTDAEDLKVLRGLLVNGNFSLNQVK